MEAPTFSLRCGWNSKMEVGFGVKADGIGGDDVDADGSGCNLDP